jgi:hypothetical protein
MKGQGLSSTHIHGEFGTVSVPPKSFENCAAQEMRQIGVVHATLFNPFGQIPGFFAQALRFFGKAGFKGLGLF